MRTIFAAILLCAAAPTAAAQDARTLQDEHYAALAERDRQAEKANAAANANDWPVACARANDAIDANDKAANRLSQLRDLVGGQLEANTLTIMSSTISTLIRDGANMRTMAQGFCTKARAKP